MFLDFSRTPPVVTKDKRVAGIRSDMARMIKAQVEGSHKTREAVIANLADPEVLASFTKEELAEVAAALEGFSGAVSINARLPQTPSPIAADGAVVDVVSDVSPAIKG